jgi:hypothetical protein
MSVAIIFFSRMKEKFFFFVLFYVKKYSQKGAEDFRCGKEK